MDHKLDVFKLYISYSVFEFGALFVIIIWILGQKGIQKIASIQPRAPDPEKPAVVSGCKIKTEQRGLGGMMQCGVKI
jgi:hypothetical protein